MGNSLAAMARVLRGFIAISSVNTVRKQVIKGIEGDMKRAAKKRNPQEEVEKLIRNALDTPEYMALLKDIDMNEEHLRLTAKEVLQNVK